MKIIKQAKALIPLSMVLLMPSFPAAVLGEPSKTPKYLMSEPMSIFDWGIYQADQKMNSFKYYKVFSTPYLGGSAQYDRDENRIYLRGMFQGRGTQEECAHNLRKVKGAFAAFRWDENKTIEAAWKVLESLFSHAGGYKNKNRPGDVGKQLIHITSIEAHILVKQPDGNLTVGAKCRSTFKTSEISTISE
jgi:hypothetical protein